MKFLFVTISAFIINLLVHTSIIANTRPSGAIEYFKQYMQNLNSIAIDFKQLDSSGKEAAGKLLISKPYKFRCNYYAPFPILIVGNKNYVSFYDYEMKQLSRIKAADNIFNFLLLDSDNLSKYFTVELLEENNDEFIIKLTHLETNKESEITFNKNTKQLQKLAIIEDDNLIEINFLNTEKVSKFAEDLFIVKNADTYGPPARFSQDEIEKKYTKAN